VFKYRVVDDGDDNKSRLIEVTKIYFKFLGVNVLMPYNSNDDDYNNN
jgi:hypothetical protein